MALRETINLWPTIESVISMFTCYIFKQCICTRVFIRWRRHNIRINHKFFFTRHTHPLYLSLLACQRLHDTNSAQVKSRNDALTRRIQRFSLICWIERIFYLSCSLLMLGGTSVFYTSRQYFHEIGLCIFYLCCYSPVKREQNDVQFWLIFHLGGARGGKKWLTSEVYTSTH